MASDTSESLAAKFKFDPWHGGDPVPPWVLDRLDKESLIRVVAVQLDLNKEVLEAHLKATLRVQEIVRDINKGIGRAA